MLSRRDMMLSVLAAGTGAALSPAVSLAAGAALSWKSFPASPSGFYRAPVLVSGATEAVLIDGGFTFPDGRALAQAIGASGKTLTTIYVSQSDPDYYFGLKPVVDAFPGAKVLAAAATVQAIQGNVDKKLAVWGPQLKENGPQSRADLVLPTVFDGATLMVDGQTIDIVSIDGLPNRRYLWAPSLRAVFGGVLVFSGVHVWTADTQTQAARAAWIAALDAILARQPAVVVPGHGGPDAANDASALVFTRDYLRHFEAELARSADSAALKAAMEARYPGLGMGVALDIGAKVAKGEMAWG